LLLGRKTCELFAGYWPSHKDEGLGINNATKYDEIKKLKAQDGPELQVHGSRALVQLLLPNNLVDEFWLKIFPVTHQSWKTPVW
jgi:dihydrofolate reductase